MTANDTQVGGLHYMSPYQHWDLVVKIGLGYLDGCSTKHVTRWRKKLGIQDLQKALHYLDKLIEVGNYDIKRNPNVAVDQEVKLFAEVNELSFLEYQFIYLMCMFNEEKILRNARRILQLIIADAKESIALGEISIPGTPEDGGHHADR
jgi:hypothetical protein